MSDKELKYHKWGVSTKKEVIDLLSTLTLAQIAIQLGVRKSQLTNAMRRWGIKQSDYKEMGLPEKECEYCGEVFKPYQSKLRYCSRSCSSSDRTYDRYVSPYGGYDIGT